MKDELRYSTEIFNKALSRLNIGIKKFYVSKLNELSKELIKASEIK